MYENNVQRLLEIQRNMDIVDTHEHLPAESARLAQPVDFSLMFGHYCIADLLAAGMTQAQIDKFRHADTPLDEKWKLFEPFYQRIQDGAYCRAAHIAIKKFYDVGPLACLADAERLTQRIREANKPGLYRRVLKDACRIRVSMNFENISDEFFAPVDYSGLMALPTPARVRQVEEWTGIACSSLAKYLEAIRERLAKQKSDGLKGMKFHLAYVRDLHFAPRTTAEAETVFDKMLLANVGWRDHTNGFEESRPLQDYLVHRMMEMAAELDLPVIFHTGMQHLTHHNIDDTDPTRLWNLPFLHRRTRFVLLHGGVPWTAQCGTLAKQYPNVWLDMAWMHIMSPEIATRALCEWIDYVPQNKIFGFGGDYTVVEKVYGHLEIARLNLARSLAKKMESGMTPARAESWLKALLQENPAEVYRV